MSNIFLASDHHLSHSGIITFLREGGSLLRDFASIEEHDEFIIHQHNKVVKPNDKVYFLGDVTFHRRNMVLLGRMNGSKVLIKGNHDVLDLKDYLPYFKDIRGCHILDKMLLTHIPIHHESLSRWKVNVHGHLHANRVLTSSGDIDQRYYSVCMEHLDSYTPISLEQLKAKIKHVPIPW